MQGYYATRDDGEHALTGDPKATHFCLTGAIHKVCSAKGHLYDEVYTRLIEAVGASPGTGLVQFNDAFGRTQPEVLAVVNKALHAHL